MWVILNQMHFLWFVRTREGARAPSLHSMPTQGAAQHPKFFIYRLLKFNSGLLCKAGDLSLQLLVTESGTVVPLPSPPASWWQSYWYSIL